jgi:hypothetical protein
MRRVKILPETPSKPHYGLLWSRLLRPFLHTNSLYGNCHTQPLTQPEEGKTIESKEMNKTKYVQLETLGGRGI